MRPTLSVIGLGKLGSSMVAALAKRGYHVIGMDVNADFVAKTNHGIAPIEETGVKELFQAYRRRICATTSIAEAVAKSAATFIVVATPSQPDGAFSNAQLMPAIKEIAAALKTKKGYHVVSITCTVMPGTTDRIIKPLMEKISGKKCGRDFGLTYNPEFIALGSVVKDFLNPDFVLVGESDSKAGAFMEALYSKVCENKPMVTRMKTVEAEIAKISLNCFCTMKIAYANMLAEIAEKIPGVDAGVITNAIGLDKRIGRKYLAPGLGFGGPCFPRDNVAFRVFAQRLKVTVPIPRAVHDTNELQPRRVVARVRTLLPRGGKVAVLGLSYKPMTPVVEKSQALEIAATLAHHKSYRVSVYDPLAMGNGRRVLGDRVNYAASTKDALTKADLCILAMPWDEFKNLKASEMRRWMRHTMVIDCWRCLHPDEARRLNTYVATGMGMP